MSPEQSTAAADRDSGYCHRVLIVDDHPEIRALVRARLQIEADIDVVGEASNGVEAVRLTKLLSPAAVVLDFEMPEMTGPEAIPFMREAVPSMGIVLYTAAEGFTLAEESAPDTIVPKGLSMEVLVGELRRVLEQKPFELMRLELGAVALRQAITAFDTWAGLNVRVLEALRRNETVDDHQLSGASLVELEALMGLYAHIGFNLQKAARAEEDHIDLVLHIFRIHGVLARRALLAFNDHRVEEFWTAWGYEVPADAMSALADMRDRLMEVLPSSAGPEASGGGSAA